MRVSLSLLPLFAIGALAQATPPSDAAGCDDWCLRSARVSPVSYANCVETPDLACICTEPEIQSAYNLCLRSACQAVYEAAAQHHRDACASAGQPSSANTGGSASTTGAVTSGSTTTPRPSSAERTYVLSPRDVLCAAIAASGVMLVFSGL
ncbi:hypothetical protein M408DRAFT_313878 [Serendipita vermifera MAFF 305830]|uniref:CFEM domain-containing protein n=1 Tax=Serendipita vermifera MAFF 305830 TaxID=933852 RepID=A0A0C2WII3_SERVB|nr:hypothetical protein M408DRAFT_313878 [Serendipita vermifera MAFF 305830]